MNEVIFIYVMNLLYLFFMIFKIMMCLYAIKSFIVSFILFAEYVLIIKINLIISYSSHLNVFLVFINIT